MDHRHNRDVYTSWRGNFVRSSLVRAVGGSREPEDRLIRGKRDRSSGVATFKPRSFREHASNYLRRIIVGRLLTAHAERRLEIAANTLYNIQSRFTSYTCRPLAPPAG